MARTTGTLGALVFLVPFLVIWCGMTGVFAGLQLRTAWQVLDARQHYREVTGTVLSSAVVADSGSDSTTYHPAVTYRYVVDDRVYTGDRYQFHDGGSSDGQPRSQAVVTRLPPGAPVVVHYDPRAPQQAVLDTGWPADYWFLWLFLQPFLMVGLFLPCVTAMMASRPRAIRRCLAGTWDAGWRVPQWGTVRDADGRAEGSLQIGGGSSPGTALAILMAAHGVCCFVAIFPLAFLGDGGEHQWTRSGAVIAAVLLCSLGCAVAAAWFMRRRIAVPLLRLDPRERSVAAITPGGSITLPWSGIGAWEVRTVNGGDADSTASFELHLVPSGGAALALRTFSDAQLAAHVATQLGRATGALVRLPPG